MLHATIDHSVTYADGETHTNTIEGFWSLLKARLVWIASPLQPGAHPAIHRGSGVEVQPPEGLERLRFLSAGVHGVNRLYYGDCLTILRDMSKWSVDLIYLDPPFNSNREYNAIYKDETGRPV